MKRNFSLLTLLWLLSAATAQAVCHYKLDTAQADGRGELSVIVPRTGAHCIAVVFRDTYGVPEKYGLAVGDKVVAAFDANLTDDDLFDGSRFWVWFSPSVTVRKGDKLKLTYAAEGKGQANILEVYFVAADQVERLRGIIAQESRCVAGKFLYTKLVNHFDHYTWQKLENNDGWVRVEGAGGCEFGPGFRKGTAEGTARSVFVEWVGKVANVRTWGYVEPFRGGWTKPIVTMQCRFAGPRLFDGKDFWLATRGTTNHGVNQLSPMFPMAATAMDGSQKKEIERCLEAVRKDPTKDPGFGGTIDWGAGPTVYVIAHLGMDHYSRHREGALKVRPQLDKERTLTAYMIRVSDGTPESNKHRWPLYYWNSWLHRSDAQPLDEELTGRLAEVNDPAMWYFAVGNPDGLKKYMSPGDVAFVQKQGSWGPNSYLMYRVARAANGKPRFIPHGHYMQPFAR